MRRPSRRRVSGLSASATAPRTRTANISGTSAITSRRSRTRARSHSSRLLTLKRRPSSPPPSSSSSARFYSDLASLIESAAKESISNANRSRVPKSPKAMPAQSLPIPWDRLKRWIADHESAEQQGHNPHPMTKQQLAGLSQIVSFVDPEPDVSDQDYVSLLMHQGLEVPVEGNFVMRWRTTCHLQVKDQTRSFPCEGHGLTQGEQPPSFGAKKASKQYAAKYALEYLQSQSPSTVPLPSTSKSTSGGAPPRPAAAPPAAKNQSMSGSSVSIGPPALTVPPGDAGGAPLAPLSSRVDVIAEMEPVADAQLESVIPDSNAEYYSEKLPSLLEQVVREGKRLNFGCPQYVIVPDPNKEGCWAGRPVFQNGGRVPSDLGHVEGAISKNSAKELIAEEVLNFFKTELDRRHAIKDTFAKAS
ncbi:hypothetical protein CCMA1212_002905 [Trichoderma ghanense]|uniref:DRBM domain-containing protein n=1 Tax=Trichoderma ghanense TaxID=65468 RepID=A0ABY2H927_9HYPO